MGQVSNVRTAFWNDLKRRRSVLITCSRTGTDLVHGRAVDQIRSSLKHFKTVTFTGRRSFRIGLADTGLILIGSPHEFSADGVRLLSTAGYPARFEVIQQTSHVHIQDRNAMEKPNPAPISGEHIGLVFFGYTNDVSSRPILMLTGSSPPGILAGALWATQSALADVPAPPCFPQHPIEARVRVTGTGRFVPALSDLETLHLSCGNVVYNQSRKMWQEQPYPAALATPTKAERSQIRVETVAGVARSIYIDEHRVILTDADKCRLLLLLVLRTKKDMWTTMQEAQRKLDKEPIPTRIRTFAARRCEIARYSKHPNLIEKTTREDGTPAYRLNADIIIVDAGGSEES